MRRPTPSKPRERFFTYRGFLFQLWDNPDAKSETVLWYAGMWDEYHDCVIERGQVVQPHGLTFDAMQPHLTAIADSVRGNMTDGDYKRAGAKMIPTTLYKSLPHWMQSIAEGELFPLTQEQVKALRRGESIE